MDRKYSLLDGHLRREHDRLEKLYLATQGGVARGNPEAINAGVVVVREHARIFGYAEGNPKELTAASSWPQDEKQRHMVTVLKGYDG